MAGFSSSTDSSSAQLLEGSETGRRFMLDYLHSKRSSRHKEEGGDGDTGTCLIESFVWVAFIYISMSCTISCPSRGSERIRQNHNKQ